MKDSRRDFGGRFDRQSDVAPQAVLRDAFLAAWVEMDCLSGIIS